MIIAEQNILDMINSSIRRLKGRVELYNGSTLLGSFSYADALQSFTIERMGTNNKFFGFGVGQKLTLKLIDWERKINIVKGNGIKVFAGIEGSFLNFCPIFYASDVQRDENTNTITVTALDKIDRATAHSVSELDIYTENCTISSFAASIASLLGVVVKFEGIDAETLAMEYVQGPNFGGAENLRQALDALAEATQSIYFLNRNQELVFMRLDRTGAAVYTIDRSQYFTLKSKEARVLANISHVTTLGDDLKTTSSNIEGQTQYIRDNPFWSLRSDLPLVLERALNAVQGLSINQLDLYWRGNFLLEIGDKINLITKDGNTITSYVLNDSITYDGGMSGKMLWDYENNGGETPSNPITIGEAVNNTYARVDKINNVVEIMSEEVDETKKSISNIMLTSDNITASVKTIETNLANSMETMKGDINSISKQVEATMTSEQIKYEIQKEIGEGIHSVSTTTGFTFNDEGLTISKTGAEMTTQITEDGMSIYRDSDEVLTVDNTGVKAENLHTTTYLNIAGLMRFEIYDGSRIGCFWVNEVN